MRKELRAPLLGAAVFLLIFGALGAYFYRHTHLTEAEIVSALAKNDTLKSLRFSNAVITKQEFSFEHWGMKFEALAKDATIQGLPISIKELKVWGEYKIAGGFEITKIIAFTKETASFDGLSLHGGFGWIKEGNGYTLDLTDLEMKSGFFIKKIGELAQLRWVKTEGDKTQMKLSYGNDSWPVLVDKKADQTKISIIENDKKIFRARLPIQFFSDLNLSGDFSTDFEWTWNAKEFHSDVSLKIKELRFNLDDWKDAPLSNQRGLAKISGQYTAHDSAISLANLKVDLTDTAFESSDHFYFKTAAEPAGLNVRIEQNEQNSKVVNVKVSLEDFPAALLPLDAKYRDSLEGNVNGSVNLKLVHQDDFQFETQSLGASFDNVSWHYNPALWGEIPHLPSEFTAKGRLNFKAENGKVAECHFDGAIPDQASTKISLSLKNGRGTAKLDLHDTTEIKNFWKSFDVQAKGVLEFEKSGGEWKQKHADLEIQKAHSDTRGFEMTSGKIHYKDEDLKLDDAHFSLGESGEMRLTGDLFGDSAKKQQNKIYALIKSDKSYVDSWEFFSFLKDKIAPAEIHIKLELKDEDHLLHVTAKTHVSDSSWQIDQIQIKGDSWQAQGEGEIAYEGYRLRNEDPTISTTLHLTGDLDALDWLKSQGAWSGEMKLATRGKTLLDLQKNLDLHFLGETQLRSSELIGLLKDPFKSFADEKKELYTQALASCTPTSLHGKIDLEYRDSKWKLNPSLFESKENASTFQCSGDYSDASGLTLEAAYLPSPACASSVSQCLSDAFPKGGVPMTISGKFSDPEVEVDFAKLEQVVNNCREHEIQRKPAAIPPSPDQKKRVRELQDFYKERKQSS